MIMAAITTLAFTHVLAINVPSNAAVADSSTGIELPPADVPVSASIAREDRFNVDIATAQDACVVIGIAVSNHSEGTIQDSASAPPEGDAVEVTIYGEATSFMANIEASEATITATVTGQDARTGTNGSIRQRTIDQANEIASITSATSTIDTAINRDTQNSAAQGGDKGNGIGAIT